MRNGWGWCCVVSSSTCGLSLWYSVSPCYLKAKLVMFLKLDDEGGIALFCTNPRALVHLGLEVSSGAHVKKYLKLCGPAGKG